LERSVGRLVRDGFDQRLLFRLAASEAMEAYLLLNSSSAYAAAVNTRRAPRYNRPVPCPSASRARDGTSTSRPKSASFFSRTSLNSGPKGRALHPQFQPYGRQLAALGVGKRRTPSAFIFFGIIYLMIRGLMLLMVGIALVVLFSSLRKNLGDHDAQGELLFLALAAVWCTYVILAGVLALKGKLAGPIMGLIDGGGLLLIYLAGNAIAFATKQPWQDPIGLVVATLNMIIVALAIGAIARRHEGRMQPQWQPASGYRSQRPANGVPVLPQRTKSLAPLKISKPQAVARVLAASVSADGMASDERLERARAEALAMLGQQRAVLVNKELAAAPVVNDVEGYLTPLAEALRDPTNPALIHRILQSARRVVEANGEVDPLAQEFLNTLERTLAASTSPTI
jgi:hypothetical protein